MVSTVDSERTELPSERRMSVRARTEFGVIVREALSTEDARCVEVSGSGVLLARRNDTGIGDTVVANESVLTRLELRLPERRRALHAWARPVWSRGPLMAYRIVQMPDVDRLSFAEHRDLMDRRDQRS